MRLQQEKYDAEIQRLEKQHEEHNALHAQELDQARTEHTALETAVSDLMAKSAKAAQKRDRLVNAVASLLTKVVKFLMILAVLALIIFTLLDICEKCERYPLISKIIPASFTHAALGILACVLAILAFWGIGYIEIVDRVDRKVKNYIITLLQKFL